MRKALCVRVRVSAADREGEYLLWVPGQRSARGSWIFHSFAPAPSHYSALSVIPLTCVSPLTAAANPDQLAASTSTATTTNTASSSLQRLAASARPQSRTRKHLCIQWPATGSDSAFRDRAFYKQSKEPTRVFRVLQNPRIRVVEGESEADLHTDFLRGFNYISAWIYVSFFFDFFFH